MNDADETPDYWNEVIYPPIASKADARRVVKLCRNGEFIQTYKPKWSTYKTAEGRIRLADFERAQDILMGISQPDPGRPGRHDWKLIRQLVLEEAKTMPKPINKTALRQIVAERYEFTLHPDSDTFKRNVRKWLSE